MEENQEKVFYIIRTVGSTKVILKMDKKMDLELKFIVMGKDMKDNLKMTTDLERGHIYNHENGDKSKGKAKGKKK